MMYNTHNQYKMNLRKAIGYKEPSPAPGTYNISNSSLKLGKKGCYQRFGSNQDRFSID